MFNHITFILIACEVTGCLMILAFLFRRSVRFSRGIKLSENMKLVHLIGLALATFPLYLINDMAAVGYLILLSMAIYNIQRESTLKKLRIRWDRVLRILLSVIFIAICLRNFRYGTSPTWLFISVMLLALTPVLASRKRTARCISHIIETGFYFLVIFAAAGEYIPIWLLVGSFTLNSLAFINKGMDLQY